MTREEARNWLPLLTEYAAGETLQILSHGSWFDHYDPRFTIGPENYRVKPRPELEHNTPAT